MKKYNAVFQGGGVKGIGLVGALARVEQENVEFAGVAGTSAGAIVAALYAAGYSTEELKNELMAANFAGLLESVGTGRGLLNLLWRYGIYPGRKIYEWIYKLLERKGVKTFSDIKKCNLKVIASNLTNRQVLVFDNASLDVEVAEAVRMSIGIPLYFQAYRYGNRLVVDGGILSNYPLWVFADAKEPTLGFKLVSRSSTAVPKPPSSLIDYLISIVGTMMEARDKEDERAIGSDKTIHIPTYDIPTTNFGLSDDQKQALYGWGYLAASEYIKRTSSFGSATADTAGADTADAAAVAHRAARLPVEEAVYESLERLKKIARELQDGGMKALEVRRRLYVSPPDAKVEVSEKLVNLSDTAATELKRGVATDTPTDQESLKLRARVRVDGQPEVNVAPDVKPSEDGRSFTVRIPFRHVVPKGHSIEVNWDFHLPGSVPRKEEYWVFPVFTKDADKFVVEAAFDKDPADQRFFVVTQNGLRPVEIAGPLPEPPTGTPSYYVYTCEMKPESPFYLLRWRLI